jgi:DnaJ-class molecular chaperone
MTPIEAARILDLDPAAPGLTVQIVNTAFRSRVKLAHPDTGGESKESKHSVQELTTAKKLMLESLQGLHLCCKLCQGHGMVKSSMGFRQCVACKGTGERK